MSESPKPSETTSPDEQAAQQAALVREIANMYANAMQVAENAVYVMTLVAKALEERNRQDPGGTQRAMDAAGMTALDRRCLCRLMEIAGWPLYSKLASGCLQIGSMANARRETKEST